ncbi:MAG: 4Fe-4S binding protein [Candidatus Aminicenantes bacterium]|nr:4Fe-4S binding protein [Candidatus Aminicenantes bacterium]
MWLTSKVKQILLVLKPGVVTLKYPFAPRPVAKDFRGQPAWDHHKCVGCGGCAAHCPARTIMVRDICQELRVMVYDGARCTYCGRCADVCPEDAITMTEQFELATGDRDDVTVTMELFMLTCQRCGRCYNMETTNMIDKMGLKGFRYDHLEMRAVIPGATERFEAKSLEESDRYKRPQT